jgi:hypothetical protein
MVVPASAGKAGGSGRSAGTTFFKKKLASKNTNPAEVRFGRVWDIGQLRPTLHQKRVEPNNSSYQS